MGIEEVPHALEVTFGFRLGVVADHFVIDSDERVHVCTGEIGKLSSIGHGGDVVHHVWRPCPGKGVTQTLGLVDDALLLLIAVIRAGPDQVKAVAYFHGDGVSCAPEGSAYLAVEAEYLTGDFDFLLGEFFFVFQLGLGRSCKKKQGN